MQEQNSFRESSPYKRVLESLVKTCNSHAQLLGNKHFITFHITFSNVRQNSHWIEVIDSYLHKRVN